MLEVAKRLPALALAASGFLLSLWLEYVHVRAYLDPSAQSFCRVGEVFNCTTVALSRASVMGGIALPVWGAVGFIALALAAWRRSQLLLPLSLVAALSSVALLLEQLLHVRSMCLLCEVVHLISFALALVALRMRKNQSLQKDSVRGVGVVFGIPLLLMAIVYLAVPPYWAAASWKSGPRLATGVDSEGLAWIGAEDPKLTVHEYVDYSCPHCAVATGWLRRKVFARPSELRVVRRHQPRLACHYRPGSRYACLFARLAVCAGAQGKFWAADDWLFHHVSGRATVSITKVAAGVGLDRARLGACVAQPQTFDRVERDRKEALQHGIRQTPYYVIDGKSLSPAQLAKRLSAL